MRYEDHRNLDTSSNKNDENGSRDERISQRNTSICVKQFFDAMPKIACAVVAVWDYIHTRDIQRFSLLLAIGTTTDLPRLKTLITKVLTKLD